MGNSLNKRDAHNGTTLNTERLTPAVIWAFGVMPMNRSGGMIERTLRFWCTATAVRHSTCKQARCCIAAFAARPVTALTSLIFVALPLEGPLCNMTVTTQHLHAGS